MLGNLMSVLLRAARVRVDANTTSDACSRVCSRIAQAYLAGMSECMLPVWNETIMSLSL